MRSKKWIQPICIAVILLLTMGSISVEAKEKSRDKEKVVLVVDLSGSMAEINREYGVADALKLAGYLAPAGTEIALIGVHSQVAVGSGFFDPSTVEGMDGYLNTVNTLPYGGNTCLGAGLERAVELLDAGGRIILVADISEGGLVPAVEPGLSEWADRIDALNTKCKENDIKIKQLVFHQPKTQNRLGQAIQSLSAPDEINEVSDGNELTACMYQVLRSFGGSIEDTITVASADTDMQSVPIELLGDQIPRVRLFIPQNVSVQAFYAGAGLEIQKEDTYTVLDLRRPSRKGLSLQIGSEGKTEIQLLMDLDLEMEVDVDSRLAGELPETQTTTVTVRLFDNATGTPFPAAGYSGQLKTTLLLSKPNGETSEVSCMLTDDGTLTGLFEPDTFGIYQISVQISTPQFTLPAITAETQVLDVRPPLPAEPKQRLSVFMAAIIGAVFIIGAAIIAVWQKRRRNHNPNISLPEAGGFFGKVQISTVKSGSSDEIRPFTVELDRFGNCREITLRELYESCGIGCPFQQAGQIRILPGADETLRVQNLSEGKIFFMGQERGFGQELRIYYNQKFYIVLKEGCEEVEIYFRQMAGSRAKDSAKALAVSVR